MEGLDEDGSGAPAVGGVGPRGSPGPLGPLGCERSGGGCRLRSLWDSLGESCTQSVYLTERRDKEVDSTTHLAGDTWILEKPLSTSIAPESIISC